LAAAAIAAFGVPFQRGLLVVGAFLLGVSAQGVKICVDTTLQEQVADRYRGRVFSVYDMLFNATYVGAAAVAATVLPKSGKSLAAMASLAGAYALVAMIFAWYSRKPAGTASDQERAAQTTATDRIETRKASSGGSLRP
jgi:MFS family permease